MSEFHESIYGTKAHSFVSRHASPHRKSFPKKDLNSPLANLHGGMACFRELASIYTQETIFIALFYFFSDLQNFIAKKDTGSDYYAFPSYSD